MRACVSFLSLVLVACGGSADGGSGGTTGSTGIQGNDPQTTPSAGDSFATQLCAHANQCGVTIDNCQAAYASIVLSSSCQQLLLATSCSDISGSSFTGPLAQCFPPCSGTQTCGAAVSSTSCNGDGTIALCVDGQSVTYGCDGVCAAQSHTYSGTCGLSANGVQSASGCATCWCE